ncbi:hypothetical protein ARMGADRAFT_1089550 [Armillaria gallica]|uniref:Uncharacterized protein n=1 Tax=Armillaria gallica TaxID=47427 RepID=A0A2H3D2G9_ARMGA|nr:hypothetical protein ARMGADRAFT_1089550 [Armillaria gallica]
MGHCHNVHKESAARACAAKADQANGPNNDASDIECTSWTGGVLHVPSDSEDDFVWPQNASEDPDWDDKDWGDDEELQELQGEELIESLQLQYEREEYMRRKKKTLYESLLLSKPSRQEWKGAEKNIGHTMGIPRDHKGIEARLPETRRKLIGYSEKGYDSDKSDTEPEHEIMAPEDNEGWIDDEHDTNSTPTMSAAPKPSPAQPSITSFLCIRPPPPLKRRKLDVPA